MAETIDRRPIAAREIAAMRWIAGFLARSGVTANGISIAGLVCGVIAGAALAMTWRLPDLAWPCWLAAAVLIQLRLAANMFDGMVALARGEASPLGELYNEIPDRISDSAILLGLGIAAGGNWSLGLAAGLSAMSTAYVRAVGKGAGARSDFSGPMAKQQRMFLVTVAALWFAFVPARWESAGVDQLLAEGLLIVIILGSLVTAIRRVVRIAAALRDAPPR
jgi:phosphatidylglycerophosphate synthase